MWSREADNGTVLSEVKCAGNSGPTIIQRICKLCESEASVVGDFLERHGTIPRTCRLSVLRGSLYRCIDTVESGSSDNSLLSRRSIEISKAA